MIAGIVLAAGGSTRLGRPKQLVAHEGQSLLRRTLVAAIEGGCRPVLAVLGSSFEAMQPEIAGLEVEVVSNAEWREGIASSIRAGVAAARRHASSPRGVLLLVCDQVALDARHVADLLAAFDGNERSIAASGYAGTIGTPALFGRAHFDELLALSGDRGAQGILERHAERLARVPWPQGVLDVDRPEDTPDVR